jgi:isopentenyl diphosphate isomerase/L-lactate dehydrogenase-like FMN-dependent dehydrogenase
LRFGADGIVVSNHGGRQLDGVSSTAVKLPEIAGSVGGRCEMLVDGGIRGGIDVYRALALGASGVLIGRAWVWALAGGGQAGRSHAGRHPRRTAPGHGPAEAHCRPVRRPGNPTLQIRPENTEIEMT